MRLRLVLTAALAATLLVPGAVHATDRAAVSRLGLGSVAPCKGLEQFSCAPFTVPLDHSGRHRRTLDLQVGLAGPADAPRGYLLVLTGGPGQPGVPFLTRVADKLAPLVGEYRVVVMDQRGTGEQAIDCADLQEETGGSDITPPDEKAVRDCAATIGRQRRYYSTADTVADLDQLRRALGVRSWAIDGTSYGTLVAERYALAHPAHVSRLVLDSIVPHDRFEPFLTVPLHATARVLRQLCAAQSCTWDPAADLARVVARRHVGVALLDDLTVYGIVDPTYPHVVDYLHEARRGEWTHLDQFLAQVGQWQKGTPPDQLSAGLHAATDCLDGDWPWGSAAAPTAGRQARYRAAVKRLPERAVWPYDRATAAGNGWNLTCLWWPSTPAPADPPPGTRLRTPALMLVGGNDLSTPQEWAQREHEMAPRSRLIVLPGAGHGSHLRSTGNRGTDDVIRFLLAS